MCLYTTSKEPLIATDDIICYKLLNPVSLESPCVNFKYELNKIFKNKETPSIGRTGTGYIIDIGYFHSFTSLSAAEYYRRKMWFMSDTEVYVAIIPKDSKYFKGKWEVDICSDTIIIKNRVN